ncbi:MAG: SDR family NAD(P)-dependent oxidoreductase [Acidobacteriota bacterium]|nr:SDR family NAD(P)-dependent oxidoreductase [Acidobacteriota bacterium]
MQAKTAVVTGAYGGLGSELCKWIARAGIQLVLVDRNVEKSKAFAAELNRSYPGIVQDAFGVDLANHSDIKRLASEILAKHSELSFLFNNAGVLTETLQFSGYGNEMQFEVNTLAPLQLIDSLRPALKKANGAVIVSTSAGLSSRVKELDWNNLVKPKEFDKLFGPYAKSKQALNVVSAALAPELANDKIVIRTADPGPNKTRLTKGAGTPLWMRLFYWLLPTPDKGAKKIFETAAQARWKDKTGIFVTNNKIQALPPALADRKFQADFLRKCRERAAIV